MGDRVNGGVDRHGSSSQYVVRMPHFFVLGTLLFVSMVAFGLGRFCKATLLVDPNHPVSIITTATSKKALDQLLSDTTAALEKAPTLPQHNLPPGKKLPPLVYSSKDFSTGGDYGPTVSLMAMDAKSQTREWVVTADGDMVAEMVDNNHNSNNNNNNDSSGNNNTEESHLPVGQHLLVDIEYVDGSFLNNEERLATAMLELIDHSGLTLLSYHCNHRKPVGVTCVGVLLESHVAFHTWPIQGTISIDLFTCGPKSLLPVVQLIEKLFAIRNPRLTSDEPKTIWRHKKRGFKPNGMFDNEDIDRDRWLLGWRGYQSKKLLTSIKTAYQEFEVYEVINSRFLSYDAYKRSLSDDGSYESQHPELYRPDKILYLDKIMQSRLQGENAYHEALVHPAIVAHDNPKRIAIVGGGEGATLRECLKYKSIEEVVMIEIDEEMVRASKQYLPEWSNCTDIQGSTPSCFDDPRATVLHMDAIAYFIENYYNRQAGEEEKYDVIIMDALDPSSQVNFSDVLYNDTGFMQAVYNALTPDGIIVAQVGDESTYKEPARSLSMARKPLDAFINVLDKTGFGAIKEYSETHGGFMGPWHFIIGFKNSVKKASWYSLESEIALKIQQRIKPSVSGSSLLKFFDSATMMDYQYPNRIEEEIFCRGNPESHGCEEGHGYNPEDDNIPIEDFEVKMSNVPGAGRGVFAKVDIEKDSYLAIEESIHHMFVTPFTKIVIDSMSAYPKYHSMWNPITAYVFAYGFHNDYFGLPVSHVDPGIMTFINHGCDGTNVVGIEPDAVTEATADPTTMPDFLAKAYYNGAMAYNPFMERNYLVENGCVEVALRNVKAGEEILDNYLNYSTKKEWPFFVQYLRAQCNEKKGPVVKYEEGNQDII